MQPLYGGCLGYGYAAGTRALHAMHGPQELFIENKHMECRGEYLGEAGYVSRFVPFLHLPMRSHSTAYVAVCLGLFSCTDALPFYLDPCIIAKEGAYCIFDCCRNKGIVKKTSAGGETRGQCAIGGGEALHALYDYRASPDIPFPPDPRPELSMQRGDVFDLKYKRSEDGWCLVSITSHCQHQQDDVGVEGWVRAMIPSLLSFLEQCNFF